MSFVVCRYQNPPCRGSELCCCRHRFRPAFPSLLRSPVPGPQASPYLTTGRACFQQIPVPNIPFIYAAFFYIFTEKAGTTPLALPALRSLLPRICRRASYSIPGIKRMQEAGLEPARYCYHRHLKPARLPIPPFLHFPLFQQLFAAHNEYITSFFSGSQHFFLFFFTITSFVLFQIYEALILWLPCNRTCAIPQP